LDEGGLYKRNEISRMTKKILKEKIQEGKVTPNVLRNGRLRIISGNMTKAIYLSSSRLTCTTDEQHMSKEPRKKAIIIAISEYNDKLLPTLEFCNNDGEKMFELLKSLGYEISDNHKLIGYTGFYTMRDAIYDFFDNRNTSADDTLLFYYSGHGVPIGDGSTCLASSETDYYSPRKMGFSSYDLTNIILESNSVRIVEILDCCYSGRNRERDCTTNRIYRQRN
jgi:hypothetical protein